jgi:hypothetical protein
MRLSVAIAAVVVTVSAFPAVAAPAIEYRGHTILPGDAPQSAQCVAMVRRGIDLLDTLPPHLRSLGHEVKDLRCEPTPPNASNTRFEDSVVGVYTIEGLSDPGGRIVFRRNPNASAAALVAISLVGNGVYARRHREYNEGRRRLAQSNDPALRARVEWLEKVLSRSDLDLAVQAECENLDARYQVASLLDPWPRDLGDLAKIMRERNCPLRP